MSELLNIMNTVRLNKGLESLTGLLPGMRLREDLGFDSLDLAEFTVRVEDQFGVDVFADGLVHTVGEIDARIEAARSSENGE